MYIHFLTDHFLIWGIHISNIIMHEPRSLWWTFIMISLISQENVLSGSSSPDHGALQCCIYMTVHSGPYIKFIRPLENGAVVNTNIWLNSGETFPGPVILYAPAEQYCAICSMTRHCSQSLPLSDPNHRARRSLSLLSLFFSLFPARDSCLPFVSLVKGVSVDS